MKFFFMLLVVLFAMATFTGCGRSRPALQPQEVDLWLDAERFIRGSEEIQEKIGTIRNLQQIRTYMFDGGTRGYVFGVEAIKASGQITVEYRFTKDGWELRDWSYKMGFPPPKSPAGKSL